MPKQQIVQVQLTKTAYRTLKGLKSGFPIIVNEGGSGCFSPEQKIITKRGLVDISKITTDDYVLSHCFETNQKVFKKVTDCLSFKNQKKCLRITLRNGQVIECTEDHKFYFMGRWNEIKNIVSLMKK